MLEETAAAIFTRHGVDFSTARRASGWTNATWLAGGLALRLSTRPGNDSLRREAQLAVLLPSESGYPPLLESGVTPDGLEWSLSAAVPGQSLGEVWPGLDWPARSVALHGLWQKMQIVHTVNPAAARGLARERAWYNFTDPVEADSGLARLLSQDLLNPQQAAHPRAAWIRPRAKM